MSVGAAALAPAVQLGSLQAGRAFAAQYVVLFHAPLLMSERTGLQYENAFFAAGHSGVEFFFVLSGFIMFLVHRGDLGQPHRAGRFAMRRFVRIYPLFWVIFTVFLTAQWAVGRLDLRLSGPIDLLRAYALIPYDNHNPPMVAAWTLSHELLFYAFLGLCILAGRAGLIVLGLWWGACLVFLALGGGPDFPLNFFLSPYNLLFLFGMVAAYICGRLPMPGAALSLAAGLMGFALTISLDTTLPPETVRPIAYGLASAAILAGLAGIERHGWIRFPRWLTFLGDASYSTYLAHSLAILACAICLAQIEVRLGVGATLGLLILAGTLGGIVVHLLIERPLLRALRGLRPRHAPRFSHPSVAAVPAGFAPYPEDKK